MAELPEEVLEVMKRKWAEMKEEEQPTKKQKTDHERARCKNCNCYRCCQHFWICGDCGISRDTFFKWINRDKQEGGRGGRGGGGSRGGKGGGGGCSRGGEWTLTEFLWIFITF